MTAALADAQPIWTPARRPSHYCGMSLYPPGFIEPCLPTVSRIVPTGSRWAFEIKCQSAFKIDPRSASNFDPLWRRVRAVAVAPSELVGVAETGRARVGA